MNTDHPKSIPASELPRLPTGALKDFKQRLNEVYARRKLSARHRLKARHTRPK